MTGCRLATVSHQLHGNWCTGSGSSGRVSDQRLDRPRSIFGASVGTCRDRPTGLGDRLDGFTRARRPPGTGEDVGLAGELLHALGKFGPGAQAICRDIKTGLDGFSATFDRPHLTFE